jgi:hypothetical protein
MKRTHTMLYTIALAAVLAMSACNRGNENRVRAASEDQTTEQRDNYTRSVEAKLDEFDQKVDGLESRAKATTGTVKTDFDNEIRALRDQRKAVAKKLDDLKRVKTDSWMSLKTDVDNALASLERNYERVAATHQAVPDATPKTKSKY